MLFFFVGEVKDIQIYIYIYIMYKYVYLHIYIFMHYGTCDSEMMQDSF